MIFRQHLPAFIDGCEPFYLTVDHVDTVLEHSKILQFAKDVGHFHRFSYSDCSKFNKDWPALLLLETHGGAKWWVLGYFNEIPSELPKWAGRPATAHD